MYGTLTSFSLKISTGMELSGEQCLAIINSNNLNVCQIVELVDVTFALYSRLCELISEQGLSIQQVLPRVLLRLDSSLSLPGKISNLTAKVKKHISSGKDPLLLISSLCSVKEKGLGPYGEAAAISMVDLKSHQLNHVEHKHQKKGLMYELECYRRANGLPCRIIHCWCMNMFNVTAERPCANSAISSWMRFHDKITDIKACHKTGLDDLLTSFYHPPLSSAMLQIESTCTDSHGDMKTTNSCSFVQDVINDIITDSVKLCKRAQILETNREINSKELHCRTNNEQQNEIDKLKIKVRDLTDIRKKQIKKSSERQCAFKQEIKKLKEKFKLRNVRRRAKSKKVKKLKNVQNELK